jgi:3-phosphoshikimate 1-carboxyvinyltransferase
MDNMDYPPDLEIAPLAAPPNATVSMPGSKSITNRALVLAALSSRESECELTGVLRSEDTEVMVDGLRQLGFQIELNWDRMRVVFHRHDHPYLIPAETAELFVGNSGTTMRFLTAVVAFGHGPYRLDGIARMRERPIEDLLVALRQIGADARSEVGNGCPPVTVEMGGEIKGTATIRAGTSSQFLSALLMVAPFADEPLSVRVDGNLVSEPYVRMTVSMMSEWGFQIEQLTPVEFRIPLRDRTPAIAQYNIEPDASAASYFFAAAGVTGGKVGVRGMKRNMLQGDIRFIEVLQQMGCEIVEDTEGIAVHGRPLRGIDVDMNDISDTVMTLAAVACFAEGPTTIRNVAHIRHKETDRLTALATELRKLGAEVEEHPDGLKITPRPLKGSAVETYNDHRMAMSLALIGLKVPGVIIKNPGCVAKTYPGFWQDFEKLRG